MCTEIIAYKKLNIRNVKYSRLSELIGSGVIRMNPIVRIIEHKVPL